MIDTTNMGIMANFIQPTASTTATQIVSSKDSDADSSLSIEELGVDSDIFSSYDSDENGLVSQTELTTAIDTAMSEFDGTMPTKEEFQAVLSNFGFEAQDDETSSSTLSSSQQETISSVLENYDTDNLTAEDAESIVAAFKEAGIQPGSELESALEEAGFDANEIGTLASVGPEGQAGGGAGKAGGGGGAEEEEEYDEMDTNEDGVVSFDEIQDYYGLDSEDSTDTLSTNNQNALDNLALLMQTLKDNSQGSSQENSEENSVNSKNFDGLVKEINNQNNNSELNAYLQNTSTSQGYAYA